MLHHCGHTFLYSLRWPHGWMLHHCGHTFLCSLISDLMGGCYIIVDTPFSVSEMTSWVDATPCGHTFQTIVWKVWPQWVDAYTIVDTPFSVVWYDLMGGCYTIVDTLSSVSEMSYPQRNGWMLHHCGHTFLYSLRWPHGWMLHHCGHTFLYSLRWPHGWMLHHCGHTFLCTLRWPHGWMLHHCVASTFLWVWYDLMGGCYTIVDTPFSVVWDDLMGGCTPLWSITLSLWGLRSDPMGGCYTIVVSIVWDDPQWVDATPIVDISPFSVVWYDSWESVMLHNGVASTFHLYLRLTSWVDATPLWTHLSHLDSEKGVSSMGGAYTHVVISDYRERCVLNSVSIHLMRWMLHHCGHTFLCSLRWPHGCDATQLWTHLSL